MIHSTFPHQNIDDFFKTYKNKHTKEYSAVYKTASAVYVHYRPSRAHLKKPSKQLQSLLNKFIEKYKTNFTDKLGKNERLNVKPISLHVDNDKLATHQPTAHQLQPYDIPYHLRQGFESKLLNMTEAGILAKCDPPTLWNTKAFPDCRTQT